MKVDTLIFQAEQCLIVPQKIQLYHAALGECKANGLHQREAEIHCRLFDLEHQTAGHQHAEDAVLADPTYGKVSIIYFTY